MSIKSILNNSIGGMSIIEMIIATALMTSSYLGYVSITGNSVKFRKRLEQKWIAKLVCRSINNSITTLTRQDLYTFIDSNRDDLDEVVDVNDIPSLSWANKWKDIYKFLDVIELEVCVIGDSIADSSTLACLPKDQIPTNRADLARHHIQVSTTILYKSYHSSVIVKVNQSKIRFGE